MKIFAVDANYTLHNNLGENALYSYHNPVIFTKADSSLLKGRRPFFLPDDLGRVCYRVSLVVRICRLGKSIPCRFAHRYYDAVTCGVDFTATDLQQELRQQGLPWDLSKSFDGAAAIGEWVLVDEVGDLSALRFRLDVNGTTVQCGFTGDMRHDIDSLVAYISRYFTLRTGDILFTGSPEGDVEAHVDDHVDGFVEDKKILDFNVK